MIPREIKRAAVKMVGKSGARATLAPWTKRCWMSSSPGHPRLSRGLQQLLSTRNEERVSLLEEAVVMAQFSNPTVCV